MGGKRREPHRERRRTKETLSEAPIRVAIATTPQVGGPGRRALDSDVELTKAALLYADDVEVVSLSMSMFDGLRQVVDAGDLGGYGLLASLDDDTIEYLKNKNGSNGTLPGNWRDLLNQALAVDPDRLDAMGLEGSDTLRQFREMAAAQGRRTQQDLERLLDEQGATELVVAIRAGAVSVADLGFTAGSTLRPSDLDPSDSSASQLWNWIDALVHRLNDRSTRLLFDKQAGRLVQHMLADGVLPADGAGLRLAAQAALGAGFAARLPCFPTAKMDELLDMRRELAVPLAKYRGAVVRFSKDMPQVVGDGLDFEVEQLWQETVHPALLILEDELAHHGLVKELARSLDVDDVRNFGKWTAGTYITFGTTTGLDALTSGLIATAAGGAATVALEAVRARRAGQRTARASELIYLYEANRRIG